MKRPPALLAALALAAPGAPARRAVDARAYVVENAVTGDVLAAQNASPRVPIASITKLMTVLVALEHLQLDDVVTVRRAAAAVGESTIELRAGERITVRDLLEGRADPERERRRRRARGLRLPRRPRRVRRR